MSQSNKNNQSTIEEGILYVLQDTRDNKIIKGYAHEGVFRYWDVHPLNGEPIDDKSYYMANYQLIERVNNGGLRQLN